MGKLDLKKYQLTLKILVLAVAQAMKQDETKDQSLKMEISKSVHDGKLDSARLKAGEVVRLRNRAQAYESLRLIIEQLAFDLPLLERNYPVIPEHLIPVLHAVIFASGFYGIKQLGDVAEMLRGSYGKKVFEEARVEATTKADKEFVQKVVFLTPLQGQVDAILEETRQFDERRHQLVENYKQVTQAQVPAVPGIPGSSGTPAGGADDDLEALRKRLQNM